MSASSPMNFSASNPDLPQRQGCRRGFPATTELPASAGQRGRLPHLPDPRRVRTATAHRIRDYFRTVFRPDTGMPASGRQTHACPRLPCGSRPATFRPPKSCLQAPSDTLSVPVRSGSRPNSPLSEYRRIATFFARSKSRIHPPGCLPMPPLIPRNAVAARPLRCSRFADGLPAGSGSNRGATALRCSQPSCRRFVPRNAPCRGLSSSVRCRACGVKPFVRL